MAIQTVNIGNIVNDGLGDDLRTAFQKVNANFQELIETFDLTGINVGASGEGIFKQKDGGNLEFKKLIPGTKILLESFTDVVRINSTQPDAFTRIDTDSGVVEADNFENITISGGDNVVVTAAGQVVTVDTILDLNALLLGFDFGPIETNFNNTMQIILSALNVDFGTITTPGPFTVDLGSL